ncbi:putative ribonuclease H-like domain-containing protein [Tanacetum coccineum]
MNYSMNYQPVTTKNKANKTAGPKEANHSAVKSSEAKNGGEKPNGDTGLKTNEELVDQEDQAFLEELKRLKRQENEANDAAEAFRKEFAQCTKDLLLQAGAARATSTNIVNTVSTPGAVADFTNLETTVNVSPIPTSRIHSIHPTTKILRDPTSAIQTKSKVNKSSGAHAFIQKVWILVDFPFRKKAIRTKWVYRNKKDERGIVVRNKARLVAQGYRQEEWIDYDKVFATVARIEVIRMFLAFASYMGFIVYQMDVKSAFLYGTIDEEVYVSQPPGFVDSKFPKKVYKVVKALYGLHQAPRAWYATLSTFLLESGYKRGTIDKTLFMKKDKNDIMLVQILDEFYGRAHLLSWTTGQAERRCTPIETQKPLIKDEEAADVDVHLYRSMIGSLMYLTASRPDIMFCSIDYVVANLDKEIHNRTVVNFWQGDLSHSSARSKQLWLLLLQRQSYNTEPSFFIRTTFLHENSIVANARENNEKASHIASLQLPDRHLLSSMMSRCQGVCGASFKGKILDGNKESEKIPKNIFGNINANLKFLRSSTISVALVAYNDLEETRIDELDFDDSLYNLKGMLKNSSSKLKELSTSSFTQMKSYVLSLLNKLLCPETHDDGRLVQIDDDAYGTNMNIRWQDGYDIYKNTEKSCGFWTRGTLDVFDWSEEVDNDPVDTCFVAASSPSSSSAALEALEVIIRTHEKNEYAWGDKYEQMEYDLKMWDWKLGDKKQKEFDICQSKKGMYLKEKTEKWQQCSMKMVPLGVSRLKKQTVLKSETTSENKSPRSKDSFGQRSRRRGLGYNNGTASKKGFSPSAEGRGNPEEELKDHAIIDSGLLWKGRLGHCKLHEYQKLDLRAIGHRNKLRRTVKTSGVTIGQSSKISWMNEFCCQAKESESVSVFARITAKRVLVTKPQMKTPYELLMGKSPNISFMKPFGCPLTILNTLDHLGKFEVKSEEGAISNDAQNKDSDESIVDKEVPLIIEDQVLQKEFESLMLQEAIANTHMANQGNASEKRKENGKESYDLSESDDDLPKDGNF